MEFKYSSNLIEETIKVFQEEDGFVVSAEKASDYLDGLSGLFMAFARPSFDGGQTSPDLISPHSCQKNN